MAHQTDNDPRLPGLRQRLETVAGLLEVIVELKQGKQHKASPVKADKSQPEKNDAPSKSDLLHDLRVACRRAETALKACRQQLPRKQRSWFRDQLRTLRKSCTPLRDEEVFHKWLSKQSADQAQEDLLKTVSNAIHDGRRSIVTHSRAAIRAHFKQHLQDLHFESVDDREVDPVKANNEWRFQCGKWLFATLDQMLQTIPATSADYDALHKLRIAVKDMRYGLEFVMELDASLTLRRSISRLQMMQDKLGDLHDAVVRLQRLEFDLSKKAKLEPLIVAAQKELQRCAATWNKWWQPAVLTQIVTQCGTVFANLLTEVR